MPLEIGRMAANDAKNTFRLLWKLSRTTENVLTCLWNILLELPKYFSEMYLNYDNFVQIFTTQGYGRYRTARGSQGHDNDITSTGIHEHIDIIIVQFVVY